MADGAAEDRGRLSILTWQVHGNYLYYLSQVPHNFTVVTRADGGPGYGPLTPALDWGANVETVDARAIRDRSFDLVLYQSRTHYERDRLELLSAAQQSLPSLYVEHDPPLEHPTNTQHWYQDESGLLVHVTPFNALMWDSGVTPVRVIEHGICAPRRTVAYDGSIARGVVLVNHLRKRGRRLGADIFAAARAQVPLDLFGMGAQSLGGRGEIVNRDVMARVAAYRFFFNPIRYTSLGLAVLEAMFVGVPVVALATTELVTVIRDGENGFIDTRPDRLIAAMQRLLADPELAAEIGARGRLTVLERFSIDRFVADWDRALRDVVHQSGGRSRSHST